MLYVELDRPAGIALIKPSGELTAEDFSAAGQTIDPFIQEYGKLNGIIIHTRDFPGWESFSALLSHLRFVRNHHRKVARVALVTDSAVGNLAERVAGHFIEADVKTFPFNQFIDARKWVESSGNR